MKKKWPPNSKRIVPEVSGCQVDVVDDYPVAYLTRERVRTLAQSRQLLGVAQRLDVGGGRLVTIVGFF